MPWTWTFRSRLAGLCAAAAFLMVGCMQFNNPVELEPEDAFGPKGSVTVEISEIDHQATVLVVELVWREAGVTGEAVLRKTIGLDGQFPSLRFVFDGLGAGGGLARVGSYVGSYPWQETVESPNFQLETDASLGVRLALGPPLHDSVPDFDRDIWGTDGDLPDGDRDTDGDETPQDGDQTDGDSDGDADGDDPDDPNRVVDIPYSPVTTDMNGILNEKDGQESWNEWDYASRLTIQVGLEKPATIYLMQNGVSLMIGADIPSLASDREQEDTLGLAFELEPTQPGTAFVGVVWRRTPGKPICEPLPPLATCGDLPLGSPNWGAAQSETSDGWQVELVASLESLGITPGTDKTLRFAVFNLDNRVTSTWPIDKVERFNTTTWGRMHSSHNWDVTGSTDGDEPDGDDPDGDQPDGDDPDGDQTDGDDPDGDQPDGDDPDGDQTDGDDPDGDTLCTPGRIECTLQGSVWHAKQCNHDGSAYASDTPCNDYEVCTLNTCVDGLGCYFPDAEGQSCDDGSYCTINDQCVAGACQGAPVICEQRACQNFTMNTGHPSCCVYSNKANGISCDDGYTCSNAECYNGTCTPNWIVGCCEGRPDMVRVQAGGAHFCIDRHEAVIGNQDYLFADCNPFAPTPARRYGEFSDDFPAGFPDTVSQATQTTPLYACNASGNNPSRHLTYFQALTACQNVGKRLCTEAEYALACGGSTGQTYPYGNTYNANTCNGESDTLLTTGTRTGCQRDGVYDQSGNLEEWIAEQASQARACGGGFEHTQADLTCTSCRVITHTSSSFQRGFRCCVNAPAGQ